MRSRGHNTFIRTNGAIEASAGEVLLSKPRADGRGAWDGGGQ
jgi:hypothetical protein